MANDISPTLRSVRELSPNLRSLFIDLDDLTRASKRGFPALASFLHGLRPTLDNLDPFLANLTPVVSWLNYYRSNVTDFLSNPPVGLAGHAAAAARAAGAAARPRQLGYITQESLAVYPNRLPENRGNGYLTPYSDIIKQGTRLEVRDLPELRLRQHRRRADRRRRRLADRLELRRAATRPERSWGRRSLRPVLRRSAVQGRVRRHPVPAGLEGP